MPRPTFIMLDRLALLLMIGNAVALLGSSGFVFFGYVLISFYLTPHLNFASPHFSLTPYCAIATGAAGIVTALLGCCAAVGKNRVHLFFVGVLILAVYLAQLAACYVANELRMICAAEDVFTGNGINVEEYGNKYQTDDSVRRSWDAIQEGYFCCGKEVNNGYYFWKGKLNHSESAPDSCCISPAPGCAFNIFKGSPHTKLRDEGCMNTLDTVIESDLSPMLKVFVTGGVLLAAVQLLAAVLSFVLAVEVYRAEAYQDDHYFYKSAGNREEEGNLDLVDDAIEDDDETVKAKRYRKLEGRPKRNKESSAVI